MTRKPALETEAIHADVHLAYKLVLAREPDLEGLRHYAQLMMRGLSFRALVGELLNSPEYRGGVDPSVPLVPDPVAAETTIKPADIIARHSVEELVETADEYYRAIADPTALMRRPFAYLHEARSAQAQYEMRDHRMLENDVDPRAIFAAARAAGFTQLAARVANDLEVSVDHYQAIVERRDNDVQRAIWNNTCDTMRSRTVFFLHKGETRRDSRSHVGLAHTMSTTRVDHRVARDAPLNVDLRIDNTGQAAWLSTNIHEYGIVRVGTHLYDRDAKLIAIDHSRHDLPRDIGPGQSIDITIEVPLPADGDFVVGIDLVAEGVIWFEHIASRTLMVQARRS